MNSNKAGMRELEDSDDFDYVPLVRVRCHTVTGPYNVDRQDYYRSKARLAASKISQRSDWRAVPCDDVRSRTSSFRSYFLPPVKTRPEKMLTTEQFWNRYKRKPRSSSLGSIMRLLLPQQFRE